MQVETRQCVLQNCNQNWVFKNALMRSRRLPTHTLTLLYCAGTAGEANLSPQEALPGVENHGEPAATRQSPKAAIGGGMAIGSGAAPGIFLQPSQFP